MFEAELNQGALFKKIIESIKDLVQDANFDCTMNGLALQAMDSSHVSLVSLLLRADGFHAYRCDRNISLGVNMGALSKLLKCGGNDDKLTMKAEDTADNVTFMFESPNQDTLSDFNLKLMSIDSERLGIPDTTYSAVIKLRSSTFQRICRDMTILGDTIIISATKEGVSFRVEGELGTGEIILRKNITIEDDDSDDGKGSGPQLEIELQEPVKQTFALRYLNFFTKATPLSDYVILSMADEVPLLVEYGIGDGGEVGFVRYYLAPKIEEE